MPRAEDLLQPLSIVQTQLVPRLLDLGPHTARGKLWLIDDGEAGTLYGGNKIRKLAWLLADAQRAGVRDLMLFGADGSHYALATARYAQSLSMHTHVLQFRQPPTEHVISVRAATERAAASVTDVSGALGPLRALGAVLRIRIRTGRWPTVLPLGGSSGLGSLGWLLAGMALRARIDSGELEAPRQIIVALGSGGTAAGLCASGLDITGVRVTPRWLATERRVMGLAGRAQRRARQHTNIEPGLVGRLTIDHRWFCGGYGRFDERIVNAVQIGRDLDLPLERTYTGKAFAAALAALEEGGDVWFVQSASRIG